MLIVILILQTAALLIIAALAIAGKLRGPMGPQGPAGPAAPVVSPSAVEAAGVRRDLAQILAMRGGEWVHHGWAQEDSDAFQSALGQPGYAVKRHGQEIEIGRQA